MDRKPTKQEEKEFILGNKAADLWLTICDACANEKVIPKKYRYTTGTGLMNTAYKYPARGKAEAHHQRRPYPVAASCMEDAASQDEHMVSTLTDPTPGEGPRAPLWREVPPAISDAQRSSASKPSKDVQP